MAQQPVHTTTNAFPTSFVVSSLVEIQEQLRKVYEGEKSCNNCEASDATRYCKQCATGLCGKCLAMHNGLKVNSKHQIIDMKDVVNTASRLLPVKEDAIMNCTDHNKPLVIFCETCQELICQTCTICHHKDHKYDIHNTIPKHSNIENLLQVGLIKMFALQDALTAVTREEEQKDDRIKEIHLKIQGVVELVTQAGEQIEEGVSSAAKSKLQLALAQLESITEFAEKIDSPASEEQEGMKVVSEQTNPDMFQPVKNASIAVTKNTMAAKDYKKC